MRFPISGVVAGALSLTLSGPASAELLYFQQGDYRSTFGPSQLWPAGNVNAEVADDFELIATLDRVLAGGFILYGTPDWQGVYVRFYEPLPDGSPGPLQREYFVAAGSPDLTVDPSGLIDVRLSPPFEASGRHFLSVQPIVDSWYWWSADSDAPRGQAYFFRDHTVEPVAWCHGDGQPYSNSNADVQFSLYGTVGGPGTIASLSATTLPRSGYLEIFGSNLGGSGVVLVDGVSAPIADWTNVRVVAHVPEAAPLGDVNVQVVTPGGASNSLPLAVTLRQPDGRVNWRLRMEGSYSRVRPARAADGTIYAIDVYSRLYAVAPNGALRWIVRGAGNKGLAVGDDGSVYVGSESHVNAYDSDGNLRWSFTQEPRAFIMLGLAVGPDGNIYGVATEGLGVFSLTPSGQLRWTNPERYDRRIVDYGEIVFGPNDGQDQLYFYANNHTRAVRLSDGASVFTIGPTGQPAVSPLDGTMHSASAAYSPDGHLLWSFTFPVYTGYVSAADVGLDGTHCVVNRTFELFALDPDGSEQWEVDLPGPAGTPDIDPTDSFLLVSRSAPLTAAGFVRALDLDDRTEKWHVELPPEETSVFNPWTAQYGFHQFVDTPFAFAPDGATAYFVAAIATGDLVRDRCFFYSVNAGPEGSSTLTDAPEIAARRPLALRASPNPARFSTELRFDLAKDSTVRMLIYDVSGRLVREIGPATAPAGSRSLWWDGRNASGARVPSGVFLVKLLADDQSSSAKVALVR